MLAYPMFDWIAGISEKGKNNQVADKNPMPELNISHLDRFPKAYEKYFNSHLYLTAELSRLYGLLKVECFNISPKPNDVILGKSGWLFLAGKYLENYSGTNLFTKKELAYISSIIQKRSQKAAQNGRTYYLVIIPDKHVIYSEFMPDDLPKAALRNSDLLIDALKTDTTVHIIDLHKTMLAHKHEQFPLYYNIDNHWNHYGAYFAYKAVIDELKKRYSTGEPIPLDCFRLDTSKILYGGEAEMLNIGELYTNDRIELTPIRTIVKDGVKKNYKIPKDFMYKSDYEIVKEKNIETLPTAVIFRDSFVDFMMPFLPEHFKKCVFIFDNWQYKYIDNIVNTEDPDIVMTFVFESNLRQISEWDSVKVK